MSEKPTNQNSGVENQKTSVIGIMALMLVVLGVGFYLRESRDSNTNETAVAKSCSEEIVAAQANGLEVSFDSGYQEELVAVVDSFDDAEQETVCIYTRLVAAHNEGDYTTARQYVSQLESSGYVPADIAPIVAQPESIEIIASRLEFLESQAEAINSQQLNDVLNDASRPPQ